MKGAPWSLTPLDVERDAHATGWIRLLSLGLRVLTRLECTVRRRLGLEGKTLAGLYAGNPHRATAQPTAERRREALQELTLTIMQEGNHTRRHLTPLSKLQQGILALLDFTPHLYTRLWADFPQPP